MWFEIVPIIYVHPFLNPNYDCINMKQNHCSPTDKGDCGTSFREETHCDRKATGSNIHWGQIPWRCPSAWHFTPVAHLCRPGVEDKLHVCLGSVLHFFAVIFYQV